MGGGAELAPLLRAADGDGVGEADLEVEAFDRDFRSAPSRCTVMKNMLSAVPGHRSAR